MPPLCNLLELQISSHRPYRLVYRSIVRRQLCYLPAKLGMQPTDAVRPQHEVAWRQNVRTQEVQYHAIYLWTQWLHQVVHKRYSPSRQACR
jgi:hypothetical protein